MPRRQSTKAKKARAAARQGAKYTAALREEQVHNVRHSAGVHSPHSMVVFDLANSPAFQAALDAQRRMAQAIQANSPAFQAALDAQRMAQAIQANSPAFQAALDAQRRMAQAIQANSPAFQAALDAQRRMAQQVMFLLRQSTSRRSHGPW